MKNETKRILWGAFFVMMALIIAYGGYLVVSALCASLGVYVLATQGIDDFFGNEEEESGEEEL